MLKTKSSPEASVGLFLESYSSGLISSDCLLPLAICSSSSLKCLLTPSHLFISLMFVLVTDNMFSLCSRLLSYSSSGPWAVLSQSVSPDASPLTNRGLYLFLALRCRLYTSKLYRGCIRDFRGNRVLRYFVKGDWSEDGL